MHLNYTDYSTATLVYTVCSNYALITNQGIHQVHITRRKMGIACVGGTMTVADYVEQRIEDRYLKYTCRRTSVYESLWQHHLAQPGQIFYIFQFCISAFFKLHFPKAQL